jgi:peptidoglycan/LPS O-acetylase OafA/YrhL
MGVGALVAYKLYTAPARFLNSWITAYWFQGLTVAVLLYHYAVGLPENIWGGAIDLPLAFLYAALIVNVALGPRRWINLEWQPLIYLGKISYGIYMFHMTIDYALRSVFLRFHWINPSTPVSLAYGALLLGLTVATAHFSYEYMERRFLAMAGGKARAASL